MTQRNSATRADLFDRPAVLFCPANRESAIAKAKESEADMVILDLEDAVPGGDKAAAREAACNAVAGGWPMPVAIRLNGVGHPEHSADLAAVRMSDADAVVLPMVHDADTVERIRVDKPVGAMIESARGVFAAERIAEHAAMLIVGTNDLAADLKLPSEAGRAPLQYAIQRILLAARASGIAAYDGVFNRIDDLSGLADEAREGAMLGFDGKTVIHPSHLRTVKQAFAPSEADIERARAILAASDDQAGAINFAGEMVEAMHVASARRLLKRVGE